MEISRRKFLKIGAVAGGPAACAVTFGKRGELLRIARQRIEAEPQRYLGHVYGELEVGGTGVLYLTKKKVAFADLGLPAFGHRAVSGLTENIQHRIFQYFIPPIAVYGLLGGIMAYNQRRRKNKGEGGEDDEY